MFNHKTTIAFENLRNLIFSLTLSSYIIPLDFGFLVTIFGIVLGAYYGLKIERETFYAGSDDLSISNSGILSDL